jgi:hypothetical protein
VGERDINPRVEPTAFVPAIPSPETLLDRCYHELVAMAYERDLLTALLGELREVLFGPGRLEDERAPDAREVLRRFDTKGMQ